MVVSVVAKSVDKFYIRYECPFCYTKYKKNGEPYKTAKHEIHKHGADGKLENRIEHRISHCAKNSHNVDIIINDDTLRL